jgi:integrase
MNKKTSCITDEQFNKIINLIYNGTSDGKIKPSEEIAIMLTITGNCALRIGDCTKLKLNSFIKEGEEYRYNIIEEKTGKKRTNIIPKEIYEMIKKYANKKGKKESEKVFNHTIRSIQYKLENIANYLGEDYKDISTHSFRKHAGMTIYRASGNDIELTRKFLNHSSINTTQRYLGVNDDEINKILKENYEIPFMR